MNMMIAHEKEATEELVSLFSRVSSIANYKRNSLTEKNEQSGQSKESKASPEPLSRRCRSLHERSIEKEEFQKEAKLPSEKIRKSKSLVQSLTDKPSLPAAVVNRAAMASLLSEGQSPGAPLDSVKKAMNDSSRNRKEMTPTYTRRLSTQRKQPTITVSAAAVNGTDLASILADVQRSSTTTLNDSSLKVKKTTKIVEDVSKTKKERKLRKSQSFDTLTTLKNRQKNHAKNKEKASSRDRRRSSSKEDNQNASFKDDNKEKRKGIEDIYNEAYDLSYSNLGPTEAQSKKSKKRASGVRSSIGNLTKESLAAARERTRRAAIQAKESREEEERRRKESESSLSRRNSFGSLRDLVIEIDTSKMECSERTERVRQTRQSRGPRTNRRGSLGMVKQQQKELLHNAVEKDDKIWDGELLELIMA